MSIIKQWAHYCLINLMMIFATVMGNIYFARWELTEYSHSIQFGKAVTEGKWLLISSSIAFIASLIFTLHISSRMEIPQQVKLYHTSIKGILCGIAAALTNHIILNVWYYKNAFKKYPDAVTRGAFVGMFWGGILGLALAILYHLALKLYETKWPFPTPLESDDENTSQPSPTEPAP